MNNKQKALNLLGLAQRAGKLISGEETVLATIRSQKSKVVVVASDASPKSIKQFKDKCETYGVALNLDYTSDEISQAIGKSRKNCAITDKGFAKAFTNLHRR